MEYILSFPYLKEELALSKKELKVNSLYNYLLGNIVGKPKKEDIIKDKS